VLADLDATALLQRGRVDASEVALVQKADELPGCVP
jgi:hypothetical protein